MKMNILHRCAILTLSAITLITSIQSASAAPANASAGRPNIILCMTDDQGWGDVSYNGLKAIRTPNLDAMAAAGLRFDRFYAAHPSCSPTRTSVMTGRHPNRSGVFWPGTPLRLQEMTLAQAVKSGGYRTAHFGKWHLSGGKSGMGRALPASDPLHPGHFGFDEWFSVSNFFETDWTFSRNGEPVKVPGDGSDAIVAEALKFIESHAAQDVPFFACIWFGSPHIPLKPTAEDLKAAGGSPYYGEILGVDRSMGALRAGLRKLGIADNTMLWFNSDNGAWRNPKAAPDANGTNGILRGGKGELWEGGIRVPGLLEWPAHIKQPAVTSVPVVTSDIYPTIVDILKIKLPNQNLPLDGITLMPLIDGQMKERPQPIGFWAHGGPAAWTDNRYKLHKLPGDKYELYDMASDISEKSEIAAEHPEIVARMKAELETWQQSVLRSFRGEDYPEKKVIEPAKPNTKPNIVIILADDLGVECLSSYGGTSLKTPNLDKLATQSMRFTRCFSNPFCSPSRASLLTGRYPFKNGLKVVLHSRTQEDIYLHPDQPSFARQLKQAGYATELAGKWHLSLEHKHDTIHQFGFDQYQTWRIFDDKGAKTTRNWTPYLNRNGTVIADQIKERYGPDVDLEFHLEFIKTSVEKKQPFLAYYATCLPHFPWEPTPDSKDQSYRESVIGRKGDPKHFPDMVAYLDKQIGRIMQTLEDLGIADNSIVIFLADNGTDQDLTNTWGDGKKIRGGKGTLTDRGTHVPLIVRWPAHIKAGTTCEDLIDFSDLFPTLCELTGSTTPKVELHGRSFAPQLLGKTGNPREWIHIQHEGARQVRSSKYMLDNKNQLRRVVEMWEDPAEPNENKNPEQEAEARNSLQAVFESLEK